MGGLFSVEARRVRFDSAWQLHVAECIVMAFQHGPHVAMDINDHRVYPTFRGMESLVYYFSNQIVRRATASRGTNLLVVAEGVGFEPTIPLPV